MLSGSEKFKPTLSVTMPEAEVEVDVEEEEDLKQEENVLKEEEDQMGGPYSRESHFQ